MINFPTIVHGSNIRLQIDKLIYQTDLGKFDAQFVTHVLI